MFSAAKTSKTVPQSRRLLRYATQLRLSTFSSLNKLPGEVERSPRLRRHFSAPALAQTVAKEPEDPKFFLSQEEILRRKQRISSRTLKRTLEKFNLAEKSQPSLMVTAIDESATILGTAQFVTERQVGSLFVVDDKYDVKGFVSMEDLVFNDSLENNSLQDQNVAAVMVPKEEIVFGVEQQSLMEVIKLMQQRNIRHLPILVPGAESIGNLNSVAHVLSVKGLIWEVYSSAMSSPEDESKKDSVHETMELRKLEEIVGGALGFPSVGSIVEKKSVILNTDVVDDVSVWQAIQEMAKNGLSYVVVRDQSRVRDTNEAGERKKSELVGLFTERDIVTNVIAQQLPVKQTLVKDVLTSVDEDEKNWICTVTSDVSLLTCMRLMSANDIRHLPVMNRKKTRVIGIVTSGDVLEAIAAADLSVPIESKRV